MKAPTPVYICQVPSDVFTSGSPEHQFSLLSALDAFFSLPVCSLCVAFPHLLSAGGAYPLRAGPNNAVFEIPLFHRTDILHPVAHEHTSTIAYIPFPHNPSFVCMPKCRLCSLDQGLSFICLCVPSTKYSVSYTQVPSQY
jgi:hypothetical protein